MDFIGGVDDEWVGYTLNSTLYGVGIAECQMVLGQKVVGLFHRKVGATHLLSNATGTVGGSSVRSFTERQLALIATEDLLDWRENQNRSAGDILNTDLAFIALILLQTGLLIASIRYGLICLHA